MKQPFLMLCNATGSKVISLLYHTLPGKQVLAFFVHPPTTKNTALVSFCTLVQVKKSILEKDLYETTIFNVL